MSALAPLPSLPTLVLPRSRPPLGRGRVMRLLVRTGLMVVASVGLVAGGLALASGLLLSRLPDQSTGAADAPASRWTDVRQPIALYDLSGTDFAKLPATYLARNREPDGAREDVLTFGRLGDVKPYLQLSLLRAGTAAGSSPVVRRQLPGSGSSNDRDPGLADALAQLAGSRGLTATGIHVAAVLETRLGPVAAADLLLTGGAGDATRPCLGFRSMAEGGTVLDIAGFACGAPGRPLSRAALACALDRVDLVSAGEDSALRAVFVAAQRRSITSCLGGAPTASLLGGGRRLGWLDPDGALPPLRGLFDLAARQR